MSLKDKLLKNSTSKYTAVLEDSFLFNEKDLTPTAVPALNIAFSGKLDGGFGPGSHIFAGPSKHFKSIFALICAKAYMDRHSDSILVFYDTEFGAPSSYFTNVGIDMKRVVHVPVTTIEEFRSDIVNQLDGLERGDHVIFIVDSIGNIASQKELSDALNQKDAADFTRAKTLKSTFRLITAKLGLLNLPLIAINHTYETIEMFSKQVMGGGNGPYYGAENIFFIGRRQEKNSQSELLGYNFIVKIEKSRYAKEGSKIPITVLRETGLNKWSGLLDLATDSGHLIKGKKGKSLGYTRKGIDDDDTKFWVKETQTAQWWAPILNDPTFQQWVSENYGLADHAILEDVVLEAQEALEDIQSDEH